MEKRTKAILVSATIALFLLVSSSLGIEKSTLIAVFAAIIMYFGLYWVLEFEIVGLRLVFLFILPVLFVFSFVERSVYFSEILGGGNSGQGLLFLSVLLGVVSYVIILTANILNVASLKKIPLAQVAQTSLYFFTVILVFLITDVIQSFETGVFIDLIWLAGATFLAVSQLIWFVLSDMKMMFRISFVIILAVIFWYVVFSYWPISFLLLNLSVAVIFYILCGFVMHTAKKSLTRGTLIEYSILIISILFLIFLSSDWGSFGVIW